MIQRVILVALLMIPSLTSAQQVTGHGTVTGAGSVGIIAPSGSGIPQSFGWFSIPNTSWASLCPSTTNIQGQSGCSAVVDAWAGGAADTVNNALYFTGGGHHDYCGNEIYKLNLNNLTMSRIDQPSAVPSDCSSISDIDVMSDGTPSARHTYGGIAFDQATGKLRWVGGGIIGNGSLSNKHFEALAASFSSVATAAGISVQITPTNGTSFNNQFGNLMEYDSSSQTMWVWEAWQSQAGHLWQGNNPLTAWTLKATYGTSPFMDGFESGAIDPLRHVFYAAGGGKFLKIDLTGAGSFAVSNVGGTNCNTGSAPLSSNYPGVDFDSSDNTIVMWNGGNSALVYNPATNACTTETYPGGPTTVGQNGTFGRWRYFPSLGVHAVVNENGENSFTLRRNVVNGFLNRSNGVNVPGGATSIVSVQNFDTFPPTTQQQYFILFNPPQILTDCTVAADGCSLKFDMHAGDFQAGPGSFIYPFHSSLTRLVGQGDEIYIQWKQRVSASMLNPANFSNFEGWKLNIVSEGDKPGQQVGGCSNTPTDFVITSDASLTPVRPWIYENCGGTGSTLNFLASDFAGIQMLAGNGSDFLDQPASGCPHYGDAGHGNLSKADPSCWNFVADEWFTVQEHIKYGTNNAANSTVDLWFAHRGQPSVLISNAADIAIDDHGGPSITDKFGKITLLPYATNATWPAAQIYYDDLIISNRRLPDPETGVPNAPELLTWTASGGHPLLTWRVNSQNSTAQDDTGFLIERCTGTAANCLPNPQNGFTQIGTTAAGASTFSDSTSVTGTTYTYRVRAKNASGNSAYATSICFNGLPNGNCSTLVAP